MADLILAIDQGTSATKACLWESPGRLVSSARVPVGRHSSSPGQVEQDPAELVQSCHDACLGALTNAGVRARDVAGVAIANQGESFLLITDDGPVTPVVGWQDTRCGDVLDELVAQGAEKTVTAMTGLPLHAEFPAPKLAHWLRRSPPAAGTRFATLDTWLINQLDPRRPHVTDRATASRTMLVDLTGDDWSAELLDLFGIPRELMPRIVHCDQVDGSILIDGHEIPLWASGYDTGLALLGHGCFDPGELKASFGTCLGVMATGGDPSRGAEGLLTTVAYTRGGRLTYALDGEIAAAGALVNWAIGLGVASSLSELDELAGSADGAGGAVIVPAISGLGAPHWRHDVTGAVVGLTEAFARPQFARATLDAIAWSLRDVLDALSHAGVPGGELRVDGGLTRSPNLMQRCADVCQVPLLIGDEIEATAYGAAALAMLASGLATEGDVREVARAGSQVTPGQPPPASEETAWASALAHTIALSEAG